MFHTNKKMYPLLVKILIWIVRIIIEIIYVPFHLIRFFKVPRKCPPIKNNILLLRASELAERIRKKKITSVAVVQAYISRINEVNPTINAIIDERFEDALREAQEADDFLQKCSLTEEQIKEQFPLLGVPITIKGSIAVQGLKHSAGRVDRTEKVKVDAVSVKLARNAGAIPLLTSNVPELCMNWETSNKLIGTTKNPYNTCRTPGGSSGGEASLLGCGASLIGIGSDIAGSLRLPAHYCGIWGHKPSPHVISTIGHYPDCKNKDRNQWNEVFTLGPLGRYASDLRLLLGIIAEPNIKNELRLHETVEIRKIKVFYIKDILSPLSNPVTNDVSNAIDEVIDHFDNICISKCRQAKFPLMHYCTELSYLHLLNVDEVENLFEGKGEGVYQELFRFLRGKSIYDFLSIGYGLVRRNLDFIPTKFMNKINKSLYRIRKDFVELLGEDGILIFPTTPHEATYHGDAIRNIFGFGYCSIFNSLGFPVTNCPVTFSRNGLPIGIQVVATPKMDRLTLSVAEEIERVFGGWKFDVICDDNYA